MEREQKISIFLKNLEPQKIQGIRIIKILGSDFGSVNFFENFGPDY